MLQDHTIHRVVQFPLLLAALLAMLVSVARGCGGKAQERQPAPVVEPREADERGRRPVQRQESKPPTGEFSDNFNDSELDREKWLITRESDFAEFAVDIARVKDSEKDGRLRLHCGTRGTDDMTVKSLGVVSQAPLDLSGEKSLRIDFDWNDQSNGCYMTGAIYLCPTLTTANPREESEWLRLEYVGVPPGRKARAAIWLRNGSAAQWIYDEGWPKKQRTGRTIGKLHIEVSFDNGKWRVMENGKLLFEPQEKWNLPFEKAYLYLQMTSHSNYPPREIFFDNIEFK